MTTNTQIAHPYDDDCLFCTEHLEEAALRILEPEDRERVERHLARCTMCRHELAELEQPLGLLAYSSAAIDPPAAARERMMSRFEVERLAPRVDTVSVPPIQERETQAAPAPPVTPRRRLPWAYTSLLAGLCVALLSIGVWNLLPFHSEQVRLPGGQVQVMAMEKSCLDCEEATGGQIGADPAQKDSLVMAWNLDPARKHEVWCVNKDGKHAKVDDLRVAETGSVLQTISFPEVVGDYQQIYVLRDDGTTELSVNMLNRTLEDSKTPAQTQTPED